MRRFALICVAAIMTAGMLHAQNPNLGTSGALFLKIPVGPRAAPRPAGTMATQIST